MGLGIKSIKKNEGFTLVELVLVIALGALIMLGAMTLYSKSRETATADQIIKGTHTIMAGLTELRLYKGALPAGSSWPASASNYVSSDLTSTYGYSCSSGVLRITSPACDSAEQASKVLAKLTDQTLCESGSTVTTGNRIVCVVKGFNGNAGC